MSLFMSGANAENESKSVSVQPVEINWKILHQKACLLQIYISKHFYLFSLPSKTPSVSTRVWMECVYFLFTLSCGFVSVNYFFSRKVKKKRRSRHVRNPPAHFLPQTTHWVREASNESPFQHKHLIYYAEKSLWFRVFCCCYMLGSWLFVHSKHCCWWLAGKVATKYIMIYTKLARLVVVAQRESTAKEKRKTPHNRTE